MTACMQFGVCNIPLEVSDEGLEGLVTCLYVVGYAYSQFLFLVTNIHTFPVVNALVARSHKLKRGRAPRHTREQRHDLY